jgi:hypothetical protein
VRIFAGTPNAVRGGRQMLVKLFDQPRQFVAIETLGMAKNVIKAAHRLSVSPNSPRSKLG